MHACNHAPGDWYAPIRGLQSLGSQADRPGSLAGLAEARRQHRGQFFTPDKLAQFMWRIAETPMNNAIRHQEDPRKLAILDNSAGSGRLLQFADPSKHALFGVDVDEGPLVAPGEAARQAGIECQFEVCGMENIRPVGFDVALINPPFSVHLDSPLLAPYLFTTYGRFGENSAAMSHAYALAQAVEGSAVVVALLPSTFAEEVAASPESFFNSRDASRLAAILDLPGGLFKEEGTEVRVSILVFDTGPTRLRRIKVKSLDDPIPDLGLEIPSDGRHGQAKLNLKGIVDDGPSITRPVTGDQTVRVVHDGRWISLRFACGLTEAKVLNAVYQARAKELAPPEHRLPEGFLYSGQGVLDVEVHLAQEDPEASFDAFIQSIADAGGAPEVDAGLRGYLKRRIRQSRRQAMPLGHTIWVPGGTVDGSAATVVGRAKKTMVADPSVWGSPVIKAGDEVVFTRCEDGQYTFQLAGRDFQMKADELFSLYEAAQETVEAGWREVHKGLVPAYPELSRLYDARARKMGIDQWMSWGFQYHDLIELMLKPHGAVSAWVMGLGKARLAVALILLSECRHGLLVTEAGAIEEMVIELKGLPIDQDDWQVIDSVEKLGSLKRINLISYERLRMPARPPKRKRVFASPSLLEKGAHRLKLNELKKALKPRRHPFTYAKALRRRCGILVADEGDVLANPTSDQSQALWGVSPKRRYVLTGTPIPNYPRDVFPILAYAGGDGTAAQPYGWHRGYLEANWRQSVSQAMRGQDAIREHFVTMEWSTREWEDTLVEGAKREIPRIKNVERFRAAIAPHIKRRVLGEPEVQAHVKIPPEDRHVIEVPWDDGHLAFYLKVAEDFAMWYRNARAERGKRMNLVALLAHIRAVGFACAYPQYGVEGFGAYNPLTSLQRWAIDKLDALTREGRRTILFAENPGQLRLIGRELEQRGVEHMLYHGEMPAKRRGKELNERFRFGSCPVLLATYGATQRALNLWQADSEILLGRDWSAKTEEQSIARALRPQQTRNVQVYYPHLMGSLDVYKAQLVAFKRDAAKDGLDWGTPETSDVEFLHLTTILDRFVEDLSNMRGVERNKLREILQGESVYA